MTKTEPKSLNLDNLIMQCIKSKDEDIKMRGRFLATGIPNTINDWMRAENERGSQLFEAIEILTTVMVGMIGFYVGQNVDLPEDKAREAIKLYGSLMTKIFSSALRTAMDRE